MWSTNCATELVIFQYFAKLLVITHLYIFMQIVHIQIYLHIILYCIHLNILIYYNIFRLSRSNFCQIYIINYAIFKYLITNLYIIILKIIFYSIYIYIYIYIQWVRKVFRPPISLFVILQPFAKII